METIAVLESQLNESRMGAIAPMYLYGTEMMSRYYRALDLKDKRVLTISGSGDQVINAYFYGAREVLAFDVNHLTCHFLALKISAIERFDYSEFIRFFGTGHADASLDYGLYQHLDLPPSSQRFFDDLFEHFSRDGSKLAASPFFYQREFWYQSLQKINSYLRTEDDYVRIKLIMAGKDPPFIESDVKDISNQLLEPVDLINLSNVPNYLTKFLFSDVPNPAMTVYNSLFLKLRDLLLPGGSIIYYAYSNKIYPHKDALSKKRPIMSLPHTLRDLGKRPEFKISTFSFKGIFGGRDTCVRIQSSVSPT